ncbi:hypothetical protein MKW98_008984 [Papaver atlanticum]|uniref:Uncharacterized protein n=1 Tax=Papaver atlanticum TaxID=357466 RepID=A0AAD4X532_9MAGN|nr:hypothetical protein MKW98_008984 [Papaver atlanticum]
MGLRFYLQENVEQNRGSRWFFLGNSCFQPISPSSLLPGPLVKRYFVALFFVKALENKSDKKEMAAVVAEQKSSLNPDAPLFIPEAFRHVEDFSPEWWDLVKTSTWFRDYWLNSQEEEEGYFFDENDKSEIAHLLPESFDLGIDEEDEFPNLEAELDDMVRSSEAEDYKNQLALENGKQLKNGQLTK